MKDLILKIIAFIGLVLTVVPAFMVFYDAFSLNMHKNLMMVGAFLWFVTAPFIMKRQPLEE